MKLLNKILASALVALAFPLEVLAYSPYIIAGGQNVGIEIQSTGVIVVGFYKVNGQMNKGAPNLKAGDTITKVNGKKITSISELTLTIDSEIKDGKVKLTINRENKEIETTLSISLIDGVYKTGLYVKDSMTGIGTLTYIDPDTGIYGALGHEIIESATNKKIEVRTGTIFKSSITGVEKSINGSPGGKNAKFYYETKYGSIIKNTNVGIYGLYNEDLSDYELIEVGNPSDIKTGEATIRTVLSGNKVEEFTINITRIDPKGKIKNLYFEITDKTLLSQTGGIVQGMSGSPIIQDGKIIGAVTHVLIDSVNTGYGIFITTMLEEGEK